MEEKEKKKEVKYYETWAELINDMRLYKVIAIVSLFGFFVMLFISIRVSLQPPMVIRVDTQGNPAIVEPRKDNTISPQEVQNFVTYYIEYWKGWDYYNFDENFNRVFTMKTQQMITASNNYLRDNKIIEKIKSEQLRYKIKLSDIVIKSQGKQFITVEATGVREEGSYLNSQVKPVRFMATLNIVVVPRTISPWGMLVAGYDERTFD